MSAISRVRQVGSNIAVFQPCTHQRAKNRQSPKCDLPLFLLVHTADIIECIPPQTVGSTFVAQAVPTAFDNCPALHETHPTLKPLEHGRDRSKDAPTGHFNNASVAVNQ